MWGLILYFSIIMTRMDVPLVAPSVCLSTRKPRPCFLPPWLLPSGVVSARCCDFCCPGLASAYCCGFAARPCFGSYFGWHPPWAFFAGTVCFTVPTGQAEGFTHSLTRKWTSWLRPFWLKPFWFKYQCSKARAEFPYPALVSPWWCPIRCWCPRWHEQSLIWCNS